MNYAALEVPDFPLLARLRLEPAGGRPLAIHSGQARRAVVLHLDPLALARGLRPGMSAVQALGLCPDLRLHPRHEAAEAEAGALLLAAAWSLAPRVEATAPGLATLDLAGREPEGLRRDLARVRATLAAQALPARVGIGPTPEVARLAAGQAAPECWVADAEAFLRPLPLTLLGLEPAEATLLESLGLRTLGELARLPAAALAQRLGERGARLHARALGRDFRPLRTATPPIRHLARHEFEHPAETLEPLLFLLRRFVERLAAELSALGLAVLTLQLRLRLEDGSVHTREFALPRPTAQPDALFRVLEHYLGTLRTETAVLGLELEALPAPPAALQEGLFETSLRDPHQFYDTLARAAALLGPERVGTPVPADSHRPDALRLAPPAATIPEHRPAPRPPAFGPPLRRFRPALAATVELTAHSAPVYLHCPAARARGAIVATRGPWRVSGEWWENAAAWRGEEWDVELEPGGLYRLAHRPSGWWLDGVYG